MGQFNSKKKTSIVKIQSGASKRLPAVKMYWTISWIVPKPVLI